MRGAIQVARIFDIPVKVHWTFSLLLIYVVVSNQILNQSGYSFWAAILVLIIFFCVVLHEFGHALMARHFGVSTRDIILSPIGGLARLDRMPEKPHQELLVAFAGPLVNFVIALVLLPVNLLFWETEFRDFIPLVYSYQWRKLPFSELLPYLVPAVFLLNLSLGVFNLLPAFPMDGGRVLRALLALRFSRPTATWVAARIGQVIAVLFGLFSALTNNFVGIFIAIFVFSAATREWQYVRWENQLATTRVAQLMQTAFPILAPDDPAWRAAAYHGQSGAIAFLVLDGEVVVGLIDPSALEQIISHPDPGKTVADWMRPPPPPVSPDDPLKTALDLIQKGGFPLLPVLLEGKLVGVFSQPYKNSR